MVVKGKLFAHFAIAKRQSLHQKGINLLPTDLSRRILRSSN